MRFRLRSLARDESADARRLSAIERALLDAIGDAELEKSGLSRRLEIERGRAAALLGNETPEHPDRDAKSERMLVGAGQNLIAGQKRVRQLDAHLEHLGRLLDLLKEKLPSWP